MTIVLGTVPYLNAVPLTKFLHSDRFEMVAAEPATLANFLISGKVACAMLSTYFLFKNKEYDFIRGPQIAADNGIATAKLILNKDIKKVKVVGVDENSLSTTALCKIVLAHRFGLNPTYFAFKPGELGSIRYDAILSFGDRALRDRSPNTIDISSEWTKMTGKPFVFALWIHKKGALDSVAANLIKDAGTRGAKDLDTIAVEEANKRSLLATYALEYLRSINYSADDRHLSAIDLFGDYCVKDALL